MTENKNEDSSAPSVFLKVLYCLHLSFVAIFSVSWFAYHFSSALNGLYGACFFLACITVSLLQMVFYKSLPSSPSKMMLLLFAPYLWLFIQYLLDPHSLSFYLVLSGVSVIISVSLSFTYFFLIKVLLKDHSYYRKHIGSTTEENSLANFIFIVLIQIIVLVIPCMATAYLLGNFVINTLIGNGNGFKTYDLMLWLINIGHNCFHQYVIFAKGEEEDIFGDGA